MEAAVSEAYDAGLADLEGRLAISNLERMFARGRLGVATQKPWVLLPLAVMGARARALPEGAVAPIPQDLLSAGEVAAVTFLHSALLGGERFLYGISDGPEKSAGIFELGYHFLSYSKDFAPLRTSLPPLTTTLREDRSNPIASGADLVTAFMERAPMSPALSPVGHM